MHGDFIKELTAEQDTILVEVQARLIGRGTPVEIGTAHGFFARHEITPIKTGHAIEQDRPDV